MGGKDSEVKHLDIHVTGKVQGVWFRASTQEQALHLGVDGFVRNEPDGSVYLEAEGDDDRLQALLDWLNEGPPMARVESVTSNAGNVKGFRGFDISR